jgi:hypothetical protein
MMREIKMKGGDTDAKNDGTDHADRSSAGEVIGKHG